MKAEDFSAYFQALHGKPPFPWQAALAAQVCREDRWPEVIDLPTGAGKTACLDVAIFHLALRAYEGRPSRASRRIVFVVDRRIVVDEAAERAKSIQQKLESAQTGILQEVAKALLSLGGDSPLQVMTLRGGMPRERSLVRDPCQPTVVLSTVDQIGSRLLFRGYGVSGYAQPMHAGLFAFDTVLLLDEAHLSEPFLQTVEGIRREQGRALTQWGEGGPRLIGIVQLTATPRTTARFGLGEADYRDLTLARRLDSSKPARLLEVPDRKKLVDQLADLVLEGLSALPADREQPRIAAVVNRVSTARELYAQLEARLKGRAMLLLLTGRSRPLERNRLLDQHRSLLKAQAEPRPGERPIIVVATQTIEVGADFDFHALYTEAASYQALKQRFGRLNRLGVHERVSAAIVLCLKGADDDPVYGRTLLATWSHLVAHATKTADGVAVVDLGIRAAPPVTPEVLPDPVETPVLTPAVVGLLAQTEPKPAVDPDIAPYLHGFAGREAEIQIVWRSGIGDSERIDIGRARAVLEALPPVSIEALPLPRRVAIAWLNGRLQEKRATLPDLSDVEGDTQPETEEDGAYRVLARRAGVWALVPITAVRPGEVIVIPSEWGGCDQYGFAPDFAKSVEDLGEVAHLESRRRPVGVFSVERLSAALPDEGLREQIVEALKEVLKGLREEAITVKEAATKFCETLDGAAGNLPDALQRLCRALRPDGQRNGFIADVLNDGDEPFGLVLFGRRPTIEDFGDEDTALQRTVPVSLVEHSRGVEAFARRLASGVGLPRELVETLALSGKVHDIGKAEPRYQLLLGGTSAAPLAKSDAGMGVRPLVPIGERHECYSVGLLDQNPQLLAEARDPALVRHLVGSHHGRGRAWQPVREDAGVDFTLEFEGRTLRFSGAPNLSAVDSGWAEQFAELNRRYGPWGLAYLETLLRLADHRRSEFEVLNRSEEEGQA